MNDEPRERLRHLLAGFDEAALTALANKGLVRRAQKDLEAGGVSHEETDAAVLVRGPGWVVTMPPEGPVRATDDTKATGVTRQILTATIYLRDQWASVGPASRAGPEGAARLAAPTEGETLAQALATISVAQVEKWAGKTACKEALALLTPTTETQVETHAGVTIRLVRHEVEARLLPGVHGASAARLLDEVLTTAPKAQHKRWVAAAVFALRQSRGVTLRRPDEEALVAPPGAPVSREQLLAAARALLESMTATGLAHPSERMVQRLFTLSVSATALNLPRLARLLRTLADDVSLILSRHANADTGRLFERLCVTHALAKALTAAGERPPRSLVGSHRTEYLPAGDLRLAGVGAYPWKSASGYEGLTVLFWDTAGRRFRTWSVGRPSSGAAHFSPLIAYRGEAVWNGGGAPEQLSRSCFTLRQARANAQGRLSASAQTTVADAAPTDPPTLDFAGRTFANWRQLSSYALGTYPLGLTEPNVLDRVVVLRPAAWGERFFDELQQSFCWPVADDEDRSIRLTLPWSEVNESAVEMLEALKPDRDRLTHVVCTIALGNRGLRLEPLSFLGTGTPQGHRVLNPGFDRGLIVSKHSTLLEKLRQKYGRDRVATTLTADDEWDESAETLGLPEFVPAGLRNGLSEAESLLLRIAESGARRPGERAMEQFRQLAARLQRVGLTELGTALERFAPGEANAGQVLWSGYVCHLHRQALGLQIGGIGA